MFEAVNLVIINSKLACVLRRLRLATLFFNRSFRLATLFFFYRSLVLATLCFNRSIRLAPLGLFTL